MAVDTRDKRGNCISIDIPFRHLFPNPDGSISAQDDRQQIARKYRGILAVTSGISAAVRAMFHYRQRNTT